MSIRKCRVISILLCASMLFGLIPGFAPRVAAQSVNPSGGASNMVNGFEGQEADVFSAMGFDTSVEPEGYDAETVDNPYGRDKLTGNQIFEMMISNNYASHAIGRDNNDLNVQSGSEEYMNAKTMMVPLSMFSAAAADFDNDGLIGEMVYVGFDDIKYNTWSKKASLKISILDAKTGTFSELKTISTAINPGQVITSGGGRYSNYDYAWQNLLQITAGDYDGDGISEFAVYVAEDGNNRVEIYKYMQTSSTPENGWMDVGNWNRVWSHVVNDTGNLIDNMVSLVSGDFNRDGVDDLGIASGRVAPHGNPFTTMSMRKSEAVLLWGARSDMLQTSTRLDLNEAELGELGRVSLLFDDLDGDGYDELIATGQPLSDLRAYMNGSAQSNTMRSIITYLYDGVSKMVINYSGSFAPVDGAIATDDDGKENWQSNNGFDGVYLSSPLMRTNAAVFVGQGLDYPMLYLDSCMYQCTEGQLQLKYCLDDLYYDGQNTLNSTWLNTARYTEFGAAAADLNGNGFRQLYTSYYTEESVHGGTTHYGGFAGLQCDADGKVYCATNYGYGDFPACYTTTAVDVDMDTVIVEYTGRHYLEYSDPKVLAIIAAAPYFEDVDIISDYDYAWQNTTSWSKTSGSGESELVGVDIEVGAYFSTSNTIGIGLIELETSLNYTLEWQKETTRTTEYTLTFETSQDEDAVAFFSIPTEFYDYRILTPNGLGGYDESEMVIQNAFQPVYQILTLEYYESICGDYGLPSISGTALTSTPGDPGSYPSSASGYDVIAQWNDDPAGVGFGNGAISQEITITDEESESYNMGAALDFQLGGGVAYDGLTVDSENVVGAQFSLNPSGGWSDINISGMTFSGTITNMPLEFQDYGYYYNWKLFAYNYKFGNGNSIPVVSYIVNDVTEPPLLPTDFQQDVERTTSESNILTWTYDGDYSSFIIYKYYDFPIGGGLQEVAKYRKGETPFLLKYDDKGNPYKEFYFEDPNLAPYAEYEYAIQVERLNQTPPLSAPSGLLTARTRAAYGTPINTVYESDSKQDGKLLLYPDKNGYLTVGVTGPDGEASADYYTTVQYQWQKQERGAWTDLVNETNKTLTIENPGSEAEGIYRCRVNALTKTDATAITSYTNPVSLTHSKRSTLIEKAYALDIVGSGVEVYAKVANAHSDSATIPTGEVTFVFTHSQTKQEYKVTLNLNAAGVASGFLEDTLPVGMYDVDFRYSGSFTFKSSQEKSVHLSGIENGYHIDVPESVTYGDGAEISFQWVKKVDGMSVCTPVMADSYQLAIGFETSPKALSNAQLCTVGQSISRGNYYMIGSDGLPYYFSNIWELSITDFVNGYVFTNYSYNFLTMGEDDGEYSLAANTYGGYPYVVQMTKDGVTTCAGFQVEKRALKLQLPKEKQEENTGADAPLIYYKDLTLVEGQWADCDLVDGQLKSEIANQAVNVTYYNTAGSKKDRTNVLDQCGYYTTRGSSTISNYSVTFQDGSMTVVGGSKEVTIGIRDFEDQDVGCLYVVSPDYDYTRSQINDPDKLVQAQMVGTRLVFTAVPDNGYEVYDWYINGVAQGITKTSISHVMLNENTTVEVQFAIKRNSLIFGTAGEVTGGTIQCSDPDITSHSVVLANSLFTFTAQAKEGYHFKEWRYTEQGLGSVYNDDDRGAMSSTFQLLMPTVSCSLYAVFERDTYRFTYTDLTGSDGLVAWYEGNPSGDATAGLSKIPITSGDQVPGGTTVVVEPGVGYKLDPDYQFVSIGTQGKADYENETYTLVLESETSVTGYAIQNSYDLTLSFDVSRQTGGVLPDGAYILYTIDTEEYTLPYSYTNSQLTLQDIPGGSKITAQLVYPPYYVYDGWTAEDHYITATREKNPKATTIQSGAQVVKGGQYRYDSNGRYYFIAPMDGVARMVGDQVTIYDTQDRYTIEQLGKDETLTVHLAEKPVYRVAMADITGKGTYSFQLPEGAINSSGVITCHENDPLVILVTPEQKWTVSYWQVDDMKVRATSLKYQFPTLTDNYTFTPIFSSTTYNTVSWPTISPERTGLTLSPESGCLSSVSAGSDFSFRLTGGSIGFVDTVLSNGQPFLNVATAEQDYPLTYRDVNGVRIYTIHSVTANQVITVTMETIGITVNGIDIAACTGDGWKFNTNTGVLTITKPSLTLSGALKSEYAQQFAGMMVQLGSEVTTLAIRDLNLSTTGNCLLKADGSDLVLSVLGSNSFSGLQLISTYGNLSLRGNGTLELQGQSSNPTISAGGSLSTVGNVKVNVKHTQNGIAVSLGGALTMGTQKGSGDPVLRINHTASGTAIKMGTTLTTYFGQLLASVNSGTVLNANKAELKGGMVELSANSGTAAALKDGMSSTYTGGYIQRYIYDGNVYVDVNYEGTTQTNHYIEGNYYRIQSLSGGDSTGILELTYDGTVYRGSPSGMPNEYLGVIPGQSGFVIASFSNFPSNAMIVGQFRGSIGLVLNGGENYKLSGNWGSYHLLTEYAQSIILESASIGAMNLASGTELVLHGFNHVSSIMGNTPILVGEGGGTLVLRGEGELTADARSLDFGSNMQTDCPAIHANTIEIYDDVSLNLYSEGNAIRGNGDVSIRYYDTNSQDKEPYKGTLPYGKGWFVDMGASAAQAETTSAIPTSNFPAYAKIYPATTDALPNPAFLTYEKATKAEPQITLNMPFTGGNFETLTGISIIDVSNIATNLTENTDYTLSGSDPVTVTLAYARLATLKAGSYTLRFHFTGNREQDMHLEITDSAKTEEAQLTVTPGLLSAPRGKEVTFHAAVAGTVPSEYIWYVNDSQQPVTSDTFSFTVPEDAVVGSEYAIKVVAMQGNLQLVYNTARITVIDAAASVTAQAVDATAEADGSYRLQLLTPDGSTATMRFQASVTMESGSTNQNIVWSVWGAQLRSTTIDETGTLQVSAREKGTGGILKAVATYTNEDGTVKTGECVIKLCAEAYLVCYQSENGVIAAVTVDGVLTDLTGVYAGKGQTVTVTAQPVDGYMVSGWKVNGQDVFGNEDYTMADNALTFTVLSTQYLEIQPLFEQDRTITLLYPTLSFESEIRYNIYYTAESTQGLEEMGMITFSERQEAGTLADAQEIIPGYAQEGELMVVQTNGIPAKALSDQLYFKVYAKYSDGSYAYSKIASYSAQTYAKSMLSKKSADPELQSLVVAMLNYGSQAQQFFGYRSADPMNGFLTPEQRQLVRSYDSDMIGGLTQVEKEKTGTFAYTPAGFTKRYTSVSFEGAFNINYYFAPTQQPDGNMTMYYWTAQDYEALTELTCDNATGSMVMTYSQEEEAYAGIVEGIAAKQLDETVFVAAVYESDGVCYSTGVLSYSLGRYCQSMAGDPASIQKDFAQATAVYGYYAKNYFAKS